MLRIGPARFGIYGRRRSAAARRGKGGGSLSPQPGKGKGMGLGPKNRREAEEHRPGQYGGGAVPGAISDLTATALSSTEVLLAYTDAAGATSHEYRVDGGTWTAVPGDKTVTGLTASTEYDFEVRGVNEHGPGPASNVATETTEPALPTPTAVTFNAADPDYLMRTSLLANAAGATQAMSIYLKFSQNTFNDVILSGENSGAAQVLLIDIGGNSQIRFFLRTAGATIILDARASITTNTTYAVFFSWDGVNGTPLLYVGSDAASAVSNLTDNTSTASATTTSAITKVAIGINRDATPSTAFTGTMTRVCVWDDVALDVTSPAVRAAMEDHEQAGSLGNNLIDVYGPPAVWNAGTNSGTGGDFNTVVGAVT